MRFRLPCDTISIVSDQRLVFLYSLSHSISLTRTKQKLNNILDSMRLPSPIDDLLYLLGSFLACSSSLLVRKKQINKKNLEETYMAPKLSEGEGISRGPLCQALDTQEGDCDKAFIMESTSEICRHRRTKALTKEHAHCFEMVHKVSRWIKT